MQGISSYYQMYAEQDLVFLLSYYHAHDSPTTA